MKNILMLMAGILVLLGSYDLHAQTINEVIVSVKIPNGLEQQGVLSNAVSRKNSVIFKDTSA